MRYEIQAREDSSREGALLAWREGAASEGYQPVGQPDVREEIRDGVRVLIVVGEVQQSLRAELLELLEKSRPQIQWDSTSMRQRGVLVDRILVIRRFAPATEGLTFEGLKVMATIAGSPFANPIVAGPPQS